MAEPAALSDDRLLDGRLRLRQPRQGYRVAIDPVLLAAFVPAAAGDEVLDVGCGTGAAALCLASRVPGCAILGLELSVEAAAIARLNAAANGFAERITVHAGDIGDPPQTLRRSFDQVMSNPPYLPAMQGTLPPDRAKARAHVESCELMEWISACLRRLRPGGWLTLVQRADRLPELLAAVVGRAGDATVLPLWPRADAPAARRVLLRARKGSRGPAVLAQGLVLHEADGGYTAEAEAVLRHGAAIGIGR